MIDYKRKKRVNRLRTINCEICNVEVQSYSNQILYCKACRSVKYYQKTQLIPLCRFKRLVSMAQNRAKAKSLPFDLDVDYLLQLYQDNQGCCALTGQVLDLGPYGKKGQVNPKAPSIDRIIPHLGYTKGNIRIITYHMNIALSDFGIDEFENLITHYLNVR